MLFAYQNKVNEREHDTPAHTATGLLSLICFGYCFCTGPAQKLPKLSAHSRGRFPDTALFLTTSLQILQQILVRYAEDQHNLEKLRSIPGAEPFCRAQAVWNMGH